MGSGPKAGSGLRAYRAAALAAWLGAAGYGCAPTTDAASKTVEYQEQAPIITSAPVGLASDSNAGGSSGTTSPGNDSTSSGGTANATPGTMPASGTPPPGGAAGSAAPMMTAGAGGMPMGTGGTAPMGTGGAGGAMTPPPASSVTTLTATITTKTQSGQYAPKNVGAIWVQDSSGKWLYTLDYWNSLTNARWLSKYSGVSGPAYVLFGAQAPTDVMTSATLPNHKTHSVTWRLKDSNGNVVPDGNYKLVIELTEFSGTGKSQEYDFTKGPGPTMVMPPDTQYYTGVQISVQ